MDPRLVVIDNGLGSILRVIFDEPSTLYSTLGSTVGMTEHVKPSITTQGGPFGAMARALSGGDFFLQKFSAETGAELLLAPKGLTDISTIKLEDNEYYIARHAYFASTSSITLAPRFSRVGTGRDVSHFHIRVGGKGTLAVVSYGSVIRVELAPSETYLINPKYLVAWDTKLKVSPVDNAQGENSKSNFLTSLWKSTQRTVRSWSTGGRELYRLIGPGDIYLASRIEPRFGLPNFSGANAVPTIISPVSEQDIASKSTKTPRTSESADYDEEKAESREVDVLPSQRKS